MKYDLPFNDVAREWGEFYRETDEILISHRNQAIYKRLEIVAAIRLEQTQQAIGKTYTVRTIYQTYDDYVVWLQKTQDKILSRLTEEERGSLTGFAKLLLTLDLVSMRRRLSHRASHYFVAATRTLWLLDEIKARVDLTILENDNIGLVMEVVISVRLRFRCGVEHGVM